MMRRRLLGMIAAAVMAAVALVACSDDTQVPSAGNDDGAGKLKITFRVASPATGISRWDDADKVYEDGTGLESTIDFASESYRVYFFDTDGKFIAEWRHLAEMHVLTGKDYWLYTFTGSVPDALKEHRRFSVMVLANWPSYPDYHSESLDGKSIGDVITNTEWGCFNAFDSFVLSVAEQRLIPFYGFASFTDNDIIFEDGTTYDLGDINLLRAMAKVEVTVDMVSLPDDVTLEGAPVVRGINPKGFCAPLGKIGTGKDWNTDYVTDIHLPFGNNSNDAGAMGNEADMLKVGDNTWIAYLPEFRNTGGTGADNCSRIELKLSYRDEPFVLNFAEYDSDGRPDNVNGRYDIRRNDLYRFNVKGDIHEIKFKLTVEEWKWGGRTEIEM